MEYPSAEVKKVEICGLLCKDLGQVEDCQMTRTFLGTGGFSSMTSGSPDNFLQCWVEVVAVLSTHIKENIVGVCRGLAAWQIYSMSETQDPHPAFGSGSGWGGIVLSTLLKLKPFSTTYHYSPYSPTET